MYFPGVSKTKTVELPVEAGSRRLSVDLVLSCEGLPDLPCRLELPASTWLVDAQADTETFAELLMSGSLSFMQSRQIQSEASTKFEAIIAGIVGRLRLARVEVKDTSASLFGQSSDGARLGFLVKGVGSGLSLEGRGEDKELLTGVIEDIVKILES